MESILIVAIIVFTVIDQDSERGECKKKREKVKKIIKKNCLRDKKREKVQESWGETKKNKTKPGIEK